MKVTIEPRIIEEIRHQTDIVMLVGLDVALKRRGADYWGCCNFHKEKSASLKIDPKTKRYHCFGCAADGDLFEWVQKTRNVSFPEAVEYLSNGKFKANGANGHAAPAKAKRAAPAAIMPVPADAPPPDFYHPRHGKPSFTWTYRNAAGELLGHVCRYDPDGEKKVFSPFIYTSAGWKMAGMPKPRPLYGLDLLAAHPQAEVIVTEGERAADAARTLCPGHVVVTWHGGTQAVKESDWTPLRGRSCVVWPDADDVGVNAAKQIVKLVGSGRIIDLPAGLTKGWDAADALAEGWDVDRVAELLREPEPADARGPMPEPAGAPTQDPVGAEPEIEPLPPPGQWPFSSLGHRHGIFFYIAHEAGDVISLTASAHTKASLTALAPLHFWEGNFGCKGREGWDAAANGLIRQQYRVGVFDATRLRGRGAWWDGGRIVVHLGDRLVVDGVVTPLKGLKSEFLYEVGPKIRLGDTPALPSREAVRLLGLCRLLSWERPLSAYLLAGWCALAPICGALQWRPSIFLSGPAGAGKTWLMGNVIGRIVGNSGLALASTATEPGIRRALGYDALPVMIDELEARDQMGAQRIQQIMGLIRYSSSETDAMIVKGSNSGQGVEYFRIRSMFCTAAIGSLLNDYADVTRNTVLTLKTTHGMAGAKRFAQIEDMQRDMMTTEWIDGLRARLIGLIPVIRKNAETFSIAGAKVLGTRRLGDQLGTLIAGAYALSSSEMITPEKAEAWLEQQDWSEEKEIILDTDGPSCFSRIMEHQIQVESRLSNGHVKRSLAELMAVVANKGGSDEISPDTAAVTGRRNGVAMMEVDGEQYVAVSNTHSEIKKILYDTPWSANWNLRLKSIKGVIPWKDPVSFGKGAVARAVLVPWLP